MSGIPDEIPELFGDEDVNSVMRRLAEFGWFVGSQIVMRDNYVFNLSEKGSARMREFARLLKMCAPSFFGLQPRTLDSTVYLDFMLGAARIAPELVSLGITERQGNALIALIAAYARKNPPPDSPPNDPPSPPRF